MTTTPILNISDHVDDDGNKVYAAEGAFRGLKFSVVVAIPHRIAGQEDEESTTDFDAKSALVNGLVGVIPMAALPLGARASLFALAKVRDAIKKQRDGDSQDFNNLTAMNPRTDNVSRALEFFSTDLG